MKFSINKSALNDVLAIVCKGAAFKAVLPILTGVLVEAEENEVVFRSTNMELSIRVSAPALIEEDGKALLPAKLFQDIVSALPDEAVNINANEDSAEISCAKSNFSIRVLNSVDYPTFPQVDPTQKVNLPYKEFSKMVKKVAKMVSKDDSNPLLQGVNVYVNGKNIELAATDTYRIAIAKAETESNNESEFSAVIPGQFLMDIASLKDDIDNATVSLSENQVQVVCKDFVFINRRIAGNFFEYNNLIPKEFNIKATINTRALTSAVKRISVLSQQSPIIKLTLNPELNTLSLSGSAQDIGSAEEIIECQYDENCKDETQEISFNCSYVLDGMSCIDTKELTLEIISDSKPGIFRDQNDNPLLYILLPVKVN